MLVSFRLPPVLTFLKRCGAGKQPNQGLYICAAVFLPAWLSELCAAVLRGMTHSDYSDMVIMHSYSISSTE